MVRFNVVGNVDTVQFIKHRTGCSCGISVDMIQTPFEFSFHTSPSGWTVGDQYTVNGTPYNDPSLTVAGTAFNFAMNVIA